MIIKEISIKQFRSFENTSFSLGKHLTAIAGRNATQKTTVLGMLGQPFSISEGNALYGCKTIDGYSFRSQFSEKFKISPDHDIIGNHHWTLKLNQNICGKDHYSVESITRTTKGKKTLRFYNAESHSRGEGYIQLPVYFLSLSRLFPIGESGRTKSYKLELSDEEIKYYVANYQTILSIQNEPETATVKLEQGTSSKTFAGINDDIHDIFTNSAGEGNITRIILAVMSFRRLMNNSKYKGGILLIDELDATLYPFAQSKLVEYLYKEAKQYKLQIIFTTHSPIILQTVNKFQREEKQKRGIKLPDYSYDSAIVDLQPQYDGDGKRTIMARNIRTSAELNDVINDIKLSSVSSNTKVNIYCEDVVAADFLKIILSQCLDINIDNYMNIKDIDLGWTNYIQLVQKKVPEFTNNLIVLDADVKGMSDYSSKSNFVDNSGNFIFLPITVEKDLFKYLKNHANYLMFQHSSSATDIAYDICFNNWPKAADKYNTEDFKEWYKQLVKSIGDNSLLFTFWCQQNAKIVNTFVDQFTSAFNKLADIHEADQIPLPNNDVNEDTEEN